jgi:hypothetical protein
MLVEFSREILYYLKYKIPIQNTLKDWKMKVVIVIKYLHSALVIFKLTIIDTA